MNYYGRFFGRPLKPFGIASCIAMLTIFSINIVDVGSLGDTLYGDLVGVGAFIAFVLLCLGWVLRKPSLYVYGLIFSAGVGMARSWLIVFLNGVGIENYGAILSFAWVIATVGAYMCETDKDWKDV